MDGQYRTPVPSIAPPYKADLSRFSRIIRCVSSFVCVSQHVLSGNMFHVEHPSGAMGVSPVALSSGAMGILPVALSSGATGVSPVAGIARAPSPSQHLCSTWNKGRGCSPSWRIHFEKSQLEAFRRGGVPVFRRMSSKPSFRSESESKLTAGRPSPPDSWHSFPIQVRPRRVVPEVMTTARAVSGPWVSVRTPEMVAVVGRSSWSSVQRDGQDARRPSLSSSSLSSSDLTSSATGETPVAPVVMSSMTASSRTVRFCWLLTTDCMRWVYSSLAHWARVAQTAGPRLRLRVFAWSAVASAFCPSRRRERRVRRRGGFWRDRRWTDCRASGRWLISAL